MTPPEILTAISIHLLIPAAGWVTYLILRHRLLAAGASTLFLAQLFLLFVCYGGVLLIVLTSLFWHWSGMASLGFLFLILVAPILLLPALLSFWKQKGHSFAHLMAFRACAGYYVLLALFLCSVSLMSSLLSNTAHDGHQEANKTEECILS